MYSQQFSIDIEIKNTKYIIYKNQRIPIDYDLLKRNSLYFQENDHQFFSNDNIHILTDEGKNIEFPLSTIKDFVSCCQNQKITINFSNVFYLNFLAKKYQVQKLAEATIKFISDYKDKLALQSLLFTSQFDSHFDNQEEEQIISKNFDDFIDDEQLLKLPFPILYRIIKQYCSENQNYNQKENFVELLFKLLDIYGKKASIFFSFFKIENSRINDLIKLRDIYSNVFDPIFLSSTLMNTTIDLLQEIVKLKNNFTQELEEIKSIYKKQEEEKIKITKIINDQNQDLKKEIDQLKAEINNLKREQKIDKIEQAKFNYDQINFFIPKNKKINSKSAELIEMIDANGKIYNVSSSTSNCEHEGHKLKNIFNGQKELYDDVNCWISARNEKNAFIEIKFQSPVVANILEITSRSKWFSESPTVFEIFGIDGVKEESLKKIYQFSWNISEKKLFTFINKKQFETYKIKFYESEVDCIGFSELNLGYYNFI